MAHKRCCGLRVTRIAVVLRAQKSFRSCEMRHRRVPARSQIMPARGAHSGRAPLPPFLPPSRAALFFLSRPIFLSCLIAARETSESYRMLYGLNWNIARSSS
jgi:hypothetical protein